MTAETTLDRDRALAELARLGATGERAAEFLRVADECGVASALRERIEVTRGNNGTYLVRTF